MSDIDKQLQKLIEKLAAIEHERWADWQQWVFESECGRKLDDGSYIIYPIHVKRWERQIAASYKELGAYEKEEDRKQVMRYWPLVTEYVKTANLALLSRIKEEGPKDSINDVNSSTQSEFMWRDGKNMTNKDWRTTIDNIAKEIRGEG